MQERHSNSIQYFNEQAITTERYVLPFLAPHCAITPEANIAEVGCGYGGNLLPFLKLGCNVWGIDISETAIRTAAGIYAGKEGSSRLTLIAKDIYDIESSSLPLLDLVIMRDTIEHIHDQERFMKHIKRFIKPDGYLFIAFPPFAMPFGGHQQLCENRFISRLPYFHLLPHGFYAALLKAFGESKGKMQALKEIKDTRLYLRSFHRIVKDAGFDLVRETLYLINPNYEVKFGLKPRKLPGFMNVPLFRELFTTACYALVTPR